MSETTGAPPKGSFVAVGDIEVHYNEYGSADKGSVVFIHGSGPGASGHSNFKGNIQTLVDAGYRVVVPDMPGFGYSSKPVDRDYTTDFFRDALVGLIQGLGIERCALIGNSLGGAISIRTALDNPDLISKLVLMAPGGIEELETYMAMPAMAKMIENFVGGALDREGLKNILTNLVFDPVHVTDELVDERWAILQNQPPEVLGRMIIPNMESELSNIQCPVLAFWGVDDELLPASGGLKITRACRPSRNVEIADCGHWVMVEYQRMFNAVCLDFLDNN